MLTYGIAREKLEIFHGDGTTSYALIGTVNLNTGAHSRKFEDLLDDSEREYLNTVIERARSEYEAKNHVDALSVANMIFRLSENIERGEQTLSDVENEQLTLSWQRLKFRHKNAIVAPDKNPASAPKPSLTGRRPALRT